MAKSDIYNSLDTLGHFKHVGAVLVEYVYHLSPDSCFEKMTSSRNEWKLMPRPWVALQFVSGYGHSPKVHISLNAYTTTLQGTGELEIKQGRFATMSKVTISSVSQVRDALELIKITHEVSGQPRR
jgi:hypothetical protein